MKKVFIITFVMLLAITAIVGCGSTAAPVASAVSASDVALPSEVSVQEAAKLRDMGAFVLDVREQSEWNEFHIPNTTLIPLGQLETRIKQVPQEKPIVVVCRSGNRSATGRDILKRAGFANVTSMNGGVTEWRNAGFPTVSGP